MLNIGVGNSILIRRLSFWISLLLGACLSGQMSRLYRQGSWENHRFSKTVGSMYAWPFTWTVTSCEGYALEAFRVCYGQPFISFAAISCYLLSLYGILLTLIPSSCHTVRYSRRTDVWNGPGSPKTSVGHTAESASWTDDDPVNSFHGRSGSTGRPYCDHGGWTTAVLRQLTVPQGEIWWGEVEFFVAQFKPLNEYRSPTGQWNPYAPNYNLMELCLFLLTVYTCVCCAAAEVKSVPIQSSVSR